MDNKNTKKKKISGIVVNTIVIVILVFVCLIALSIILSAGKGYTNLFGSAYVSVQSDSMEGTDQLYEGEYAAYSVKGFKKGDLLRVRILNEEQGKTLQVGDVITFRQSISGKGDILNTHRVVEVTASGYKTLGDKAKCDYEAALADYEKAKAEGRDAVKPTEPQPESVPYGAVVGKYEGHRIAGLGKAVDFFHSSAGFFVCVVLPSFLIVAYFAFNLFVTVKSVKASYAEAGKQDEEAQMREKILQELREQGKIVDETPAAPETPAQQQTPEEKPEETTNGEEK